MNDDRPPDRATWFKFFGQRYLMGGSLRAECAPDERSVWTDFLCLANAGGGHFDCAKRDALAVQLLITRELLDRAIDKFIETGRLRIERNEPERKDTFIIVKWEFYQTRRVHKKGDAESPSPSPLPLPLQKERKKERERERERATIPPPKIQQKGDNSGAELSPPREIPSSKNTETGRVPCDDPPNDPPNDAGGELIEEETPKGLPFKTADELRDLRREHNDLIRLSRDEKQMARWQENRVSVLKRAAIVRQRYEQVKADAK